MERLPTNAGDSAGAVLPAAEPMTLVGIGASAGGLKALKQFFAAVEPDSGMAYVVIVHLDPARESRMAELLQDGAAIPVTQVTGQVEIEANHAYIIPPDRDITVEGTTLGLRDRGERSQHAPVDLFFRMLAEAYGARAVGVVLSGTGVDGTLGVRSIREAGGITLAQTPDEAEHGGMPASAVATGLVDRVLPVGAIPAELARLQSLPDLTSHEETAETAGSLATVFGLVRSRTGHDFSRYKRSMVLRRLGRRLKFNDMTSVTEYIPLLESSREECRALMSDMLISVSSFFRDPAEFEALAARMPRLFEMHVPADGLRVWVVGCATGEEAYSVAMVLAEHAATLADPPRIQVFATDIDERGYAQARAGLYSAAAVAGMTPERRERFFREEAGSYRVSKELREMVLFAGHNVLHDPPFSRLDLITCRNLFIYLREETQRSVLDTFHFALRPHGLLFLGAAESVGADGLFAPVTKGNHRLFRRNESAQRLPMRAMAEDPPSRPEAGAAGAEPRAHRDNGGDRRRLSYGPLHLRMLEEYAPPSVIVDEHLDVVHMSETAGEFLRLGGGVPSRKVLSMASEELRRGLRTMLHHAFRDATPVTRRIRMRVEGVDRLVTVRVRPSVADQPAGRHALVVFEPGEPAGSDGDARPEAARSERSEPANTVLEEELARTRDLLESTTMAHDSTVADLQTVNEELQSINEEQRAATQELETGREEIQAINEELTTINQEHQSTIEELKRTNADLQNLIESTAIGTIFLDRAMRIRRFTPAAAAIFNFLPSDHGRPLADITHGLDYPDMAADVAAVVDSLQPMAREVGSAAGEWFMVRIHPYRSFDGAAEGVVLTLVDYSEQHEASEALRSATLAAEAASVAKSNFLSSLSHEFRTPLTAMLGYADLLQIDGQLSEAQDGKVERIKVGGWHLVSMINEILSVARLDGGRETIEPVATEAGRLVKEAAALTEPAAQGKGLAMVLDLPPEPMPLVTDPAKVRQVLINLCENAIKYTAEGEVRLRLYASGEKILFEVRDTGVGIAPEHLSMVFERFWQVESGATRTAGGVGIGLSAAREFARLLRGDIEVWSEPGRGSVFTLWLPADYARR